jgi:hypothetical protein
VVDTFLAAPVPIGEKVHDVKLRVRGLVLQILVLDDRHVIIERRNGRRAREDGQTFPDVHNECARDWGCVDPIPGEILYLETLMRGCLQEL